MKRCASLLLVVFFPAAAFAQSQNYAPYNDLLAKECGAKHLEFISPGDLNDIIYINFETSLSEALRNELSRADDEKIACANVTMGATCSNVAGLRAMTKIGLLARFAKFVCYTGLACRGQSECDKPHP